MLRKPFVIAVSLALSSLTVAHAADAADQKAATTNPADFGWLNAATLPQPARMIDAAIDALPRTFSEKQDWLKRMHKAAWYPNLELRYGIGQGNYRRYQVLENRQQVTTGSSSSRSSSSQNSQGTTFSTDTGGGISVKNDSGGSSQRSSSRSSSVTDEGPDSFVRSEDLRWMDDYGVYLSWDLSRLVFRQEEISVVAAEIDKEKFRQDIRSQVIQTYYDLKESLLLLESDSFKDSIPTRMRKERLAFLLDTLTGGALSGSAKK